MKVKITTLLSAIFSIAALCFYSCEDKIDSEYIYTFKEKTMGQYIEEDANLSDFETILQRTKTKGLLKAYGVFTCFAPDNNALKNYYAKKGKSSLDDFTDDELKQITYDHLVNGDTITSALFGIGRLGSMSMSNRFLSISYSSTDIFVNGNSQILQKDISVHNGVIHVISEVIDPSMYGIVAAILQDEKFSIFADALIATNLVDSLQKESDETYDPNLYTDFIVFPKESNPGWRYDVIPWMRKYGYTVFMENNETMNENGISDLESLKKYAARIYDKVYPDDAGITDVTDRRNSLNRFVAYHLVNKNMSVNKLIDAYDNPNQIKTHDLYEYLETMCPNTLIEIKKERNTGRTNLINLISRTGKVVQITDYFDKEAANGIYHEIDNMLVYDEEVLAEHSGKRLRFDLASFFPEFTNNNIRGYKSTVPCPHWWFPRGYLERIECSEQTVLGYVASNDRLCNYQGDELFMDVAAGKLYDFTLTTPPIPKGIYEVRIGYMATGARGMCQIYFDGMPAGVPVNLIDDGGARAGWQKPGSDQSDPQGYENDKVMRNLGYMKGPTCFWDPGQTWTRTPNARMAASCLRKILGIYEFDSAANHLLTVKGLSNGQFQLDYMEFVPSSVLESEDIY